MQITILAVGSRGDVQPTIALGQGFQRAGHRVRLATHAEWEPFVRDHGLDFALIPGNPFSGMNAGLGQLATPSAAGEQRPYQERLADALEQWMSGGLAASHDADAIIYSQLCFVGAYVGEKLGVPSFAANYSPLTRTRAFPTIYGRGRLRLGGGYNWLTHVLDQQIFWRSTRAAANRARQRALDLPPLPLWGPFGRMQRERHPILYAYSPSVMPKPADWGSWITVTGFWFLDRATDWQPPADLVRFLEGPRPVFVGLGSVANSNPIRVTRAVLSALARAKQRVVIAPGQVDLSELELPDEHYIVSSVPHDWLFPQMAAVIHHGGAGTFGATARAGVPSLAIPFFGDQPFWGRRACELGVGVAPIPYNQVSVEQIAAAVQTLTTDRDMQRRAAELAQRISAEDGVARAIEAVEARVPQRAATI